MQLIPSALICLALVFSANRVPGTKSGRQVLAATIESKISRTSKLLSDILSLPKEDVIPTLVRTMREDSVFQDPNARYHAYYLLVNLDGARYEAARRQFIEGLGDPVVGCLCLYALGTVPANHRDEMLPLFEEYLTYFIEGKVLPCNEPKTLFEAIGNLGRSARRLAKPVLKIVADTSRPVSMRGAAARALPRVADPREHIRHIKGYPKEDPLGAMLMLHALLLEGEQQGWSMLKEPGTRQAMQELVLALLDVRKVRTLEEQLKLKPYAKELQDEVRLLKERMDFGDVLLESIVRLQRPYASDFLSIWIRALHPVSTDDPSMTVRLAATTKLMAAQKQLSYLGY